MNCNNLCFDLPAPSCYQVFNDGDTTAAYSVDFVDNVVTIGDADIVYNNIGRGFRKPALICPQDAVAQESTLTPLLQNCCDDQGNATWAFTLTWTDDCDKDWQRTYTVTLCCTDLVVADITAAMTAKINNDVNSTVTATDNTTNVGIKADTPGQGYKVNASSKYWTVAATVENSIEFGDAQYFIDKFNIPADQLDMTATYQLLIVKYWESTPDTANPTGGGAQQYNGGTHSMLNVLIWKECYFIVQTGGTAEADVLSDADKICDIFSGNYSDVTQYFAVTSEACPCV